MLSTLMLTKRTPFNLYFNRFQLAKDSGKINILPSFLLWWINLVFNLLTGKHPTFSIYSV